jgi:photosystem II stability/assembly factor-like uncharacterized protein
MANTMKNSLTFLILLVLIFSCKSKVVFPQKDNPNYNITVSLDTIFTDKISIRAILIDKNKVWYAADKNRFGYYDLKKNRRVERKISKDSLQFEFRSIAQTEKAIFVLSIGNPALLYKISKKDLSVTLVYKENHEKVFYDAIQFWNNKEGIAIGDPTQDCFSIIITRDGGNSWNKIPCQNLPKLTKGEAAFAASNTNICIKGSKTFIVSGGTKSRVFVSENKGLSWNVYETPITQGHVMTGIFSADFYTENTGIVVGGNYEEQSDNSANKAITNDGGKTWKLIGANEGFGYASCVQFVPHSNGNLIVTVGTTGIYFSNSQGTSWKKLSDDKDLFTLRFQNDSTAFAAGKIKLMKITLHKN